MKFLVVLLIRVHYLLNQRGIRARGLGWAQRLLRKQFVFKFLDKKFFYLPSIEGSYDYLIIGKSNEPETQIFLSVLLNPGINASFIDVGASIGEFVFSVSRFVNIKHIYAFEPRPDCALVLRKNKELNDEKRIIVIEKAAGNREGSMEFHLNPGGTSSGIHRSSINSRQRITVECTRLDSVLPEYLENPIILVDVEGAEPLVLEGAEIFIKNNSPLIIFEFNNTSKRFFQIDDIWNILGKDYDIYRLRSDGKLDRNLVDTWNCVAVSNKSEFYNLLQPHVKDLI
jgi:FkbM family methyltransferase